ncbi:MAG: LuxR C-terminal-related transcriptional regulator, partial [Chloroflexota bacterium]
TLVLDDYHMIALPAIDDALIFLLDHLPPQMHLVITTRQDPPFPLARYRVRNQMTELRAADLRFTPVEATEFLNQVMSLTLTADDVEALDARTEGWIAGLQLAALSIRGRADVSAFIRAFAGNNRHIVAYLVEEVLQSQPQQVQHFLRQTAILDRLSRALCDAVTERNDSHTLLQTLEQSNLFIIPLDDKGQWYRYHHLFADVLQTHLMEAQPDQVPTLHRRASRWYEQNGLRPNAIHHAFAATDFERAADLVELEWSAIYGRDRDTVWLGWVEALPHNLVRARPVLSAGYAWSLMIGGDMEAAEVRLQDAEWWLETQAESNERAEGSVSEMVVADEAEFHYLPATIATIRAFQSQAIGDASGTKMYAQQALDVLSKDDYFRRAIPASILGLAYWTSGNLVAAHQSMTDAVMNMRLAGNIPIALSGASIVANIEMAQGRLRKAVMTCEQALQLATEHGVSALEVTTGLYLGLSELSLEQGDLDAATQYLFKYEELGRQAVPEAYMVRYRLTQAQIKTAQGDLEGALVLLDEAERLYVESVIPNVTPVAAVKARVWLKQNRLTDALDWMQMQGLSVDDDLNYVREYDHLTLARVLLAQYWSGQRAEAIHEVLRFLERLLNAANAGERTGSVIEILMLQTLALEAQGDTHAALLSLEQALMLAAPEGYVLLFLNEGPQMARLLSAVAPRGVMSDYIHKLLAVLASETPHRTDETPLTTSPTPQPLIEPLSQRELEILHLIAQGLSNREIGERLFLALSTVKTHNRNIFGKLAVQRRTEAVARARALGLL